MGQRTPQQQTQNRPQQTQNSPGRRQDSSKQSVKSNDPYERDATRKDLGGGRSAKRGESPGHSAGKRSM